MSAADPHLLPPAPRRRAYASVFIGAGLSTTGFIAASTVHSLIAEDLTGSATWSGLPAAAGVLGTAAGATTLAALLRRAGPRRGLTLGYTVSALAIAAAASAILARSFALFVVSMFVFGVGYGANRLARYVVGDMYPAESRGTMIGWVVWASTIGAVAGPALLAPSRTVAGLVSDNDLVGPYLICLLAMVLSSIVMAAAPRAMDHPLQVAGGTTAAGPPIGRLLSHPPVALALASMVSGQFVMVLLMTVTPLHVRHGGHGLGAIGLVISAHTLGMYALSPLTGRLADRVGRVPLLVTAVGVLVLACALGVMAAAGSYPVLVAALFLLGLGWNFGFVGGSALLSDSVAPADRTRVQGFGDTLIWGGGAIASLGSGWLLEHAGFGVLSLCGAALALAPLVPFFSGRASRERPRAAEPAAG